MKLTGTMPQSILIIRPSAMGDIIMASPMLAALRRAYPQARISWLVEPGLADLLQHNPDLDELILWPKGEWNRFVREKRYFELLRRIIALRRELRSHRFDLAIDAVGLVKSRFLLWLSGAQETIGFLSKEPGAFLLDRKVSKGKNDPAMSSEYRQMIVALGLDPGPFVPQIFVAPGDREIARQLFASLGVGNDYLVFAPFTTRPQKHWFDERWSLLAGELVDKFGKSIIILGGPGDAERGAEIVRQSGRAQVYSLCGRMTLGQSAAVIEGATLLIGVDTGLTHMGTAFSLPTLALFGATCPYQTTPSPRTRILYDALSCSPCRRKPTCHGQFDCMRALTVEKIVVAATTLLEEERETL
ncbi:MAG: lipopolysaccharide heptosyltransferase [Deltaproteobacteria bacterium HGW-Deltaproteobacteria-4]|nr:MAG: lipopolysaccharide heptosyltransferase [Deltaproteobacteria bacterium HGW-Deltaproteobacteria-4]